MFFALRFLFSSFIFKGTQWKKGEGSSLWLHSWLSRNKDEDVMKINANEDVTNNNSLQKSENSQENFYDKVCKPTVYRL